MIRRGLFYSDFPVAFHYFPDNPRLVSPEGQWLAVPSPLQMVPFPALQAERAVIEQFLRVAGVAGRQLAFRQGDSPEVRRALLALKRLDQVILRVRLGS